MAESYDAIVIGAGHNGLVCAAYLARAGLRTLVLERRGVLGGACVTEEVWPGYRVSTASYVMSLLQPKIIPELELRKFGFEVLPTDHLFVPFPDGRYFVYWDDAKKTWAEIAKFSRGFPKLVSHLGVPESAGRRRSLREEQDVGWVWRPWASR